MQSSQHILQESVKGMRDELKECYVRIKDYEFKEDEWKQSKEKMENFKVSLYIIFRSEYLIVINSI